MIFSDESNFQLINRKTTPRVRRFRHEKYDERFVQKRVQGGGGSIGVWGCLGQLGAGCCTTYKGRLKAKGYLDILENQLIPSLDVIKPANDQCIFQQDNAPCHTAKIIERWFKENKIEKVDWPANSPDLNPIEHFWSKIDKKLVANPPKSLAELEVAITKLWNEIKPEDCVTYIESMSDRVKLCIKAKGGYFKY